MDYISLDELVKMFEGGLFYLEIKKEEVNKLNVFPVPDGDTGTNMYLTFQNAIEDTKKKKMNSIKEYLSVVSNGSLIGARGNSGVILSQIIKGLSISIDNKTEIKTTDLKDAFIKATEIAYKAVMTPVEGTILTIIKAMATKANLVAEIISDCEKFLEEILIDSKKVLQKTIDMLPALKEAGVVDAGGQGLVYILEGALLALRGEIQKEEVKAGIKEEALKIFAAQELTYIYDTVVLISKSDFDKILLEFDISGFGDSMVVAQGDDLTKIHIHTNTPNLVLEQCLKYGEIKEARIENMQEEQVAFATKELEKKEKKPYEIIVVAQGEGFKEIFNNLGVSIMIEGGDTMNPSTNDILKAIEEANSDNIILFPNNKNIILASNQARDMSSKKVEIISTTSVAQAISSILTLDLRDSYEENIKKINNTYKNLKYFSITYAIKDAKTNGLQIKEGEIIGILNDKIVSKGNSVNEVLLEILEKIENFEENELITLYKGKDLSDEEINSIVSLIEENYKDKTVELIYGGQPYYFIIGSIE